MKKKLPKFKNEDEEREFWSEHDSTEYIDWNNAEKASVRGKYAKSLQEGYSVRVLKEDGTVEIRQFVPKENAVVLDPDVKAYFPDSESVNNALRSLINIIPEERLNQVAENQGKYDKK
jgi:hypothetical protein